jgi:hypothetical protein
MITIKAAALTGMLTDILRTAGKDATMPMFHQVHLFSAGREGVTVLVAESTDRFVAGQAWDEASGELPSLTLAVADVKALLSAVKGQAQWVDVDLLVEDGRLVVKVLGLRAEYLLSDATFPEFVQLEGRCTPTAEIDGVAFKDDVLSPLATIAKRRREPMEFAFSGRTRGARVHIGDKYQAVAMPLNGDVTERPGMISQPSKMAEVA